ncbi:MAG: hypothetical protein NTX12_01320, partial [Actinobacteria bacterium]|nr:hypothetical protein [Actinomycetota bacterium]
AILIRYIQLAGDPSVSGTNIYTVESYENLASFKADVLRKDFSTDSEFLINGRTGRYVDATRTFLMVRLADNKEVFEIHFAHPQTVPQLEQMAASLVPVE